jgi:hypothetical protein
VIGEFLNLRSQKTTVWYPGVGDVTVFGTVVAAWKMGGGLVAAWADQNVPGSQWALAPTSGPQGCSPISYGNPLVLPFDAVYLKPVPDHPGDFYEIAQDFCVGVRCSFDVIAGPYSAGAQNLVAL